MPTSPEVLEDLVWSAYEKFNERDFEGSVALCHDDCVLYDMATGAQFPGKEGWRLFMHLWVTAFPDCRVEHLDSFARGDTVAIEFVGRGTHTGPLLTLEGEIPPTGRSVEWRICDIKRVKDGQVIEGRAYTDVATVFRQLGVIPERLLDLGRAAGAAASEQEANQALALRWFDALSRGDLDVLDEVFAPDYVLHMAGGPAGVSGPEAIRVVVESFRFAFPDLRFTVQGAVAEGDTVVVRWVAEGTQHGPLLGRLPSDRRARWTGMSWLRFAGGKIIEDWVDTDLLGMMQQLGILAPAAAEPG
ncbi:MAG TPA: ester cyclase family protein [Longimicrobiaceae bacterium]|nr:ester cyclase family protein [Longimicrobiaceae bacterium]